MPKKTRVISVLAVLILSMTLLIEQGAFGNTSGGDRIPAIALAQTDEETPPDPMAMAEELWQEMQAAQYEESWATIPGKGAFYAGQPPHGALLTTYLNPGAEEAMNAQPGEMPDGAVIVKVNYTGDQTLDAITVMQKRAGFDPEYGDWFWARYGPEGEIAASGRVVDCVSCHVAVQSNDYIFTFPIATMPVPEMAPPEPPEEPEPEPLSDEELIALGEEVYLRACAACHQADGQGVEAAYPPLAGNSSVLEDPGPVIRVVLSGRAGMPRFELPDQEVAAILSYVRNAWENDAAVVTPDQVQEAAEMIGEE
jgi:mono/diheme cytochrome c family protein